MWKIFLKDVFVYHDCDDKGMFDCLPHDLGSLSRPISRNFMGSAGFQKFDKGNGSNLLAVHCCPT